MNLLLVGAIVMDVILVAALSVSAPPYISPSVGIDKNRLIVASVVAPTPPYTPPVSGVDQNRPPIVMPQTSPTRDSSESWEQKMLRRYGRKVA